MPYVFFSTWPTDVLGHRLSDSGTGWEKLGQTPGGVPVPPNCELGLCPNYGLHGDAFGQWVQDLADIDRVRHLDLYSMGITDADLAHLRVLTSLSSLDLRETQIAGEGLVHLRDLPDLTTLSLAYCKQLTGAGLASLRFLTGLTSLDLSQATITDASLAYLADLTSLTVLELFGCNQLTEEGLASLRRPGLEIDWWSW